MFRDIARATDERTMIACIAPPGTVFGHTATVEKTPWARSLDDALLLCAVFNSFAFDWLVRLKAATHVSLYLLDGLPMPDLSADDQRFLARAAAILSGHASEEYGPRCARTADEPLLELQPDLLRAQIDGTVARGYRLTRKDYAHVLTGFSHRIWPRAKALCLEAFDFMQTGQVSHQNCSRGHSSRQAI